MKKHVRTFLHFLIYDFLLSCSNTQKLLAATTFSGKSKLSRNRMVVSAHPLATQVEYKIIKNGGNAIDAMVAVHFSLAVVYPSAGNITS